MKNKLATIALSSALLAGGVGVATAAQSMTSDAPAGVELVEPAAEAATPPPTSTATPEATQTPQESTVPKPVETTTTTTPAPEQTRPEATPQPTVDPTKPKPSPSANLDATPGRAEQIPVGDPRREIPPSPVLGGTSFGEVNGYHLPASTVAPTPAPTGTTSATQ